MAWQAAAFEPGDWVLLPQLVTAGSNPDDDLRTNFEEYAFGSNPLSQDGGEPEVSAEVVELDGARHLGIRYKEMLAADDVVYRIHGSSNLKDWVDVTDLIDHVKYDPRADGVIEVLACLRENIDTSPYRHLKIHAELIPRE